MSRWGHTKKHLPFFKLHWKSFILSFWPQRDIRCTTFWGGTTVFSREWRVWNETGRPPSRKFSQRVRWSLGTPLLFSYNNKNRISYAAFALLGNNAWFEHGVQLGRYSRRLSRRSFSILLVGAHGWQIFGRNWWFIFGEITAGSKLTHSCSIRSSDTRVRCGGWVYTWLLHISGTPSRLEPDLSALQMNGISLPHYFHVRLDWGGRDPSALVPGEFCGQSSPLCVRDPDARCGTNHGCLRYFLVGGLSQIQSCRS
jgi:hypothetical protein